MSKNLHPVFAEPHTEWRKMFALLPTKTIDKGVVWLSFYWERTCVMHEYLPDGGDIFLQKFKYINGIEETQDDND